MLGLALVLVFKINSFNSHACRSMRKRKFCNDREEELISLYLLSVMTGAFEEEDEEEIFRTSR